MKKKRSTVVIHLGMSFETSNNKLQWPKSTTCKDPSKILSLQTRLENRWIKQKSYFTP